MILYLDFVVRITSPVQTLILDLVLPPYEIYFQMSPKFPRLSRPPAGADPEKYLTDF